MIQQEYMSVIMEYDDILCGVKKRFSKDMILNEKSKELYGEGHRFWDMIRCNKSIEYNDEFPGITPVDRAKVIDRTFYQTILPIFKSEMNTNKTLEKQQNPGY